MFVFVPRSEQKHFELLRKELPGLRGFSARNLRNMRTFVQGESRDQVDLGYAEPPPKVHLYEEISAQFGKIIKPLRAAARLLQ